MLVSPSRYPGLEQGTLEALTKDIVLGICERIDERALEVKHIGQLQRWLDVRSLASDVLSETLRSEIEIR